MSDVTYTISRTTDFYAFWADALAQCGVVNELLYMKETAEATINAGGTFSTVVAGVKVEYSTAALALAVDAAQKFEMHSLKLPTRKIGSKAALNTAKSELIKVKDAQSEIASRTTLLATGAARVSSEEVHAEVNTMSATM